MLTLHTPPRGQILRSLLIVGLKRASCRTRARLRSRTRWKKSGVCQVGITRAMQRLYPLLYTFKRSLYGRTDTSVPSSFLRDIPAKLLDTRGNQARAPAESAGRWPTLFVQLTRWGSVQHPLRASARARLPAPRRCFVPAKRSIIKRLVTALVIISSEVRAADLDEGSDRDSLCRAEAQELLQSFANLQKM